MCKAVERESRATWPPLDPAGPRVGAQQTGQSGWEEKSPNGGYAPAYDFMPPDHTPKERQTIKIQILLAKRYLNMKNANLAKTIHKL